MKKNILFVMNNLNCGGAEKSLISLLQSIDYKKYHVDLLLFKCEGIFLKQVPSQVNILEEPQFYKYFDMSTKKAVIELVNKGEFQVAIARMFFSLTYKRKKSPSYIEQYNWRYLSKGLDKIQKVYDVAIGYLEKNPNFFVVDKVNAKKKVGWIHNDYEKLDMDKDIDSAYFSRLDTIVTVSEECGNVLKKLFPKENEKIEVICNLSSKTMIEHLSKEKAEELLSNDYEIAIVTIGRLNYQKGYDIAIDACKHLVNRGYNVKWYVIGEGEERSSIEQLVRNNDLENNFILLGIKENPYPYVKKADIYVQTSRFEGKSIAVDEAKILCKPIVVTDFSTAKDQIEDRVNGIIAKMDGKNVAKAIEELINDNILRAKLENNLKLEHMDTEKELNKIYRIFDSGYLEKKVKNNVSFD